MKIFTKIAAAVVLAFTLAVAISGYMYFMPKYRIYEQGMRGQALLAHAQASKEVAVAEAKAKMESATLLAQAEVERAKGVAQANEIIGKSLKSNESYLRYLWITEVAGHDVNKTVVYIPTEAGVPVMEATRISQ